MILLFTDFGLTGPYIGQLQAILSALSPSTPVVNLFAHAPAYHVRASSYLLSAYQRGIPNGSVFVCVVDPDVGSKRAAVVLKTAKHYFVGPENGLFDVLATHEEIQGYWEIIWRPRQISTCFHGRDLFAPVAARIATGDDFSDWVKPRPAPASFGHAPYNLHEAIFIDHFGNIITGAQAHKIDNDQIINLGGEVIEFAETYCAAADGQGFWLRNSSGLVEIAVNLGSAANRYHVNIGQEIEFI